MTILNKEEKSATCGMKSLVVAGLMASLATLPAVAGFEVKVWRGETTAVLVPDNIELGSEPEGISVRRGSLQPVRYRANPRSLQLLECYDRVEWESENGGPRVVEVSAPTGTKPGVYRCGMMDIRVIDRVLPPAKEWKYYLDLWQHPWAAARIAGVRPFSPEHYNAMRPTLELLATAGQKALTVTLVDQPWNHQCRDAYGTMVIRTKFADGSWKNDYTIFDEYVEFGRSCGIGPHIACYTLCPWGNRVSWREENGTEVRVAIEPGSPEFEEYWGTFLKDFAAHLKAKGWFDDAFIAMDELAPETVRTIADTVQRYAPGLKISMAGNRSPSEFDGINIDNYSQAIWHIDDKFLSEVPSRREKGFITTYYVCCSPATPNSFLRSSPTESFLLGVMPALTGLDGFLRWAWNSWPQDPLVDASFGNWLAGDVFLCYPSGVPSWRFLEIRNGIIAAEKMRILNANGERLDAMRSRFDLGNACSGRFDFDAFKAKVQEAVNSELR